MSHHREDRLSLTLGPGEVLRLVQCDRDHQHTSDSAADDCDAGDVHGVVPVSATRCGNCGSRTDLRHFVLYDLRLFCACTACVEHDQNVDEVLRRATEVTP
jgi:hypothetical protein